jgi:hypothetical protein
MACARPEFFCRKQMFNAVRSWISVPLAIPSFLSRLLVDKPILSDPLTPGPFPPNGERGEVVSKDWQGRVAPLFPLGVCVITRVCVSFRGGRRGDRRGISQWLENTQSEIPRSARNDSLGSVIRQIPLEERGRG